MSDGVTDLPGSTISKIICLLTKHQSHENKNFFLHGSVNRDGNTFLPLDPISEYSCNCSQSHNFIILSKVDYAFYAVKIIE